MEGEGDKVRDKEREFISKHTRTHTHTRAHTQTDDGAAVERPGPPRPNVYSALRAESSRSRAAGSRVSGRALRSGSAVTGKRRSHPHHPTPPRYTKNRCIRPRVSLGTSPCNGDATTWHATERPPCVASPCASRLP